MSPRRRLMTVTAWLTACSTGETTRAVLDAAASEAPSAGASAVVPTAAPAPPPPSEVPEGPEPTTPEAQRARLLALLVREHGLSGERAERLRRLFAASPVLGQGHPAVTEHPWSRAECRLRRGALPPEPALTPPCPAPHMAPLYDPEREPPTAARVCIDRFELPNVPCEYPITWISAKEASELCSVLGKRLCDAHEWEGACAGRLLPASEEYAFGVPRKQARLRHNERREIRWAYGPVKRHELCGTGSRKSRSCDPIGWKRCGPNSYPTGSFPECRSPLGVFDLHGNVAEHMSLPTRPEELGGRGHTEMKGSWFLFGRYEAHPDDCRWRAPDWHATPVDSPNSHLNYHLGARCCADVGPPR